MVSGRSGRRSCSAASAWRSTPQPNLLRSIERSVELTSIWQHVEPLYSANGRPSADRGLMVGMLLFGYRRHIRFERRFCGKAMGAANKAAGAWAGRLERLGGRELWVVVPPAVVQGPTV